MKRLRFLVAALLVVSALATSVIKVSAAATNLIANPGLETASGTAPASWTSNKWGTNTTTFTYATTAHTGTKSVQVKTTAYTSGDAKWYANAVPVTAGTTYTYSDWYQGTVATQVVLAYTNAAGTYTYADLPDAAVSTAWKQYTGTFTVPSGITKVEVYHLLQKVGALTIDDVSLTGPDTTTPPVDPPVTPPASGTNLIANPSFVTASGTNPASWTSEKWGTNTTAFAYATTGHTDAKSAKTTISAYTSGDAKWTPAPVAVTAGKTYTYSDWYKSSVATEVVVAYITSAGVYTYATIGTPVASNTAWTQYTGNFVAPTGTAKVTIYHLINKVGNLNIDDVSLVEASSTTPPTNPLAIPNPSMEEGTTTPTGWQSSGWGTNTAKYQYLTTDGHAGTKSTKVTVSNYTDGDAKWMFNPITTLTPGHQYRLTAWYKTNTQPKMVAMFTNTSGVEDYFGMPIPEPAANSNTTWTQYSDTFRVPDGTASVSLFMFLDRNGWLQTDDYSLTDYTPTGFSEPLLTLTFDDGHEDNVTNALPLLNQYGFKTTQCFETQTIIDNPAQSESNVKAFFNTGHEICSHTITHPMLTTIDDTQLKKELTDSKSYLESIIGQAVPNFASPYGDYNKHVNDVLKTVTTSYGAYTSHRTVDEGFNSKDNYDPYRLRVQNIFNTTTAAQVTAWINQAKTDHTWLVLVYHRVVDTSKAGQPGYEAPGEFDSPLNLFSTHLSAIQQSGIKVQTMKDALAATKAQL